MVHHAPSGRNEVGQAFLPVHFFWRSAQPLLEKRTTSFGEAHNRLTKDRQECLSYIALTFLLGENDCFEKV
jgi:hypothetical protein